MNVSDLAERGFLVSPELAQSELNDIPDIPENITVLNKDSLTLLNKKIDWIQFERLRVLAEKGMKSAYSEYLTVVSNTDEKITEYSSLRVINSYEAISKKFTVQDFVEHLNARYKVIEGILRVRPELQSVTSINRVIKKKEKEQVSIIGMVTEKSETKNGNYMVKVEDSTGTINAIISKSKPELFSEARNLVNDEIIGVEGVTGNKIIFANNIYWPDVPFSNIIKKVSEEIYAAFISDVHVGSKFFLREEFNKFLRWINCKTGSDAQKEIAGKVRYLFIIGDMVDGVGIYPEQDKELDIKDIYDQYKEFASLISQVPDNIKIIICPGNHDAVRLSEPQPPLDISIAQPLYNMPNVIMVSNPALISLKNSPQDESINVLMYHGYSFDYYVANVDSIRSNGGYQRADIIMKFLLKRRHLGPAMSSTLRIPDAKNDALVIKTVPDIFVTGHIHYSLASNYRGITMISCSCWQSTTTFQEKLGHKPEPARVPLVNLKTRDVKIMKFI